MEIQFPDKKYSIIYADPPWSYRDKANAGKRGASHKYPVQSISWIKSLPVSSIANENSVLFLWATMPLLQEALDTISAWGFNYKTNAFTWVKTNKKNHSTFFFGMGNWTRSNAELCLLGVKGKPKRISAKVHSIVQSPIECHSKKPDLIRDKIIELIGNVPRIELFARQNTVGWDVWGNDPNLNHSTEKCLKL